MEVLPSNIHMVDLTIPLSEASSTCISRVAFNSVVMQLRKRRNVWRRRPDAAKYRWYLRVWYLDSDHTKCIMRVCLFAGATKPVFGVTLMDNPRPSQVLPVTLTTWWHEKIVSWQQEWVAAGEKIPRKPHDYFTQVFVTPR